MKKQKILPLVLGMLVIFSGLGYGQDQNVIENRENGTVNWTEGIITATGIGAPPERFAGKPQGRPMAIRAAKIVAMRALLEIVNGVRIDSQTTVEDFAVSSDIIKTEVKGMVKGAQIIKQEYMSDGTVEMTMQMSLRGDFSHLVLPKDDKPKPEPEPEPVVFTPAVLKENIPTPPPIQPTPEPTTPEETPPPSPPSEVFTGLVVDARGIGVKPAMAPKILDENGEEVYGSAYVDREHAVKEGMSGYAKDVKTALKNQRVTDNPLVVKGVKTEGAGRSDVVISNADASRLRSDSEHLSYLKQCRVMIVLD